MADLTDTFGEEFAKRYQQEKRKRQERRNKVDEETMGAICARAINQNEFEGGNPQFEFTDEQGVTHTVMLMQFPDMESDTVYTYANELSSGAVSIPFDYMGEWVSCLFNEGKEKVAEFTEGDHYILVGEHGTYTSNNGDEREQLSPVRGIANLDEAKNLADKFMSDEGFGESDDTGEDDPFGGDATDGDDDVPDMTDRESGSSDSGSDDPFADAGDDDSEDTDDDTADLFSEVEDDEDEDDYPIDEVQEVVDALGDKDDRVWEVDEGSKRHKKLTNVVMNRVDGADDEERTANEVINYIHGDDEDEPEEDDEEDNLFA